MVSEVSIMIGEIFVGLLFAGSIYFAYWCGKVDCSVEQENEDE